MASLSPSSSSLASSSSSDSSSSPSRSNSSSGLSSMGSAPALPTADIRITYEAADESCSSGDEASTAPICGITRPGMIGNFLERNRSATNPNSPTTPFSLASSDCLGSSPSLNSPMSRASSPAAMAMARKKAQLTIHGLGLGLNQMCLGLSPASSMDEGIFPSPLSSPIRSTPSSPIGPKFKIIHEGDIHLCRLNHQRTVISKILSSKFLRRWETHRLYLTSVNITSKLPVGFMEIPIAYSQIEDVYCVSRWDSSQKFFIRIVIPDGSVLLQLPNKWVRDQWLHSINWKRLMLKYQRVLVSSPIRHEALIRELKGLIDLTLTTPLQDECIYQTSLDIINELLQLRMKDFERKDAPIEAQVAAKKLNEEIIECLAPLLERTNPSTEICRFLSKHCRTFPRSAVICECYTEIVQRILKHNMDFGKYPRMRILVQDYLLALNQQNDGPNLARMFIATVHGHGSTCPHPRVCSNIVSVCLAAIFALFEHRRVDAIESDATFDKSPLDDNEWSSALQCFVNIFSIVSQFVDWRPLLAQILQPIPFPDAALTHSQFTIPFKAVITNIGIDERCDVHQMLMGVREGKDSWLEIYSPGNVACDDDGVLWSQLLNSLIECCCRRKRFFESLIKTSVNGCIFRAKHNDTACQNILCDILELDMLPLEDGPIKEEIVKALQSTETGLQAYEQLCQRQEYLKQLQKEGGPSKLTLPARSTDSDLVELLSRGSFGNLESLSLAFTQISGDCADALAKLSSLKELNLWSTQFSDEGLQILAERLPELVSLNLCETAVTDNGIQYLPMMKSLRKVNLNSTRLSAQLYDKLKHELPDVEFDVRYTDAWYGTVRLEGVLYSADLGWLLAESIPRNYVS